MQMEKFRKNSMKIIAVLLAAGILLAFHLFPVLVYCVTGENVYEKVSPVHLSGKTVFISDMHLTRNHLKEKGNFPVNLPDDTKNLVIAGDLFDSPEFFNELGGDENDVSKPFCTALKFINNSPGNIYFTVGTPVHDPGFLADSRFSNYEINCNQTTIHIAGRAAIFEIDGLNVAAHHGDYIASGVFDCMTSYFSKKLGKPLILERLWKSSINLDNNYWLITAHSHIPAIDYKHKIANPGAWNPVPVIGGDLKNAVVVENGSVLLVKLN